jgi:hypothetical protein
MRVTENIVGLDQIEGCLLRLHRVNISEKADNLCLWHFKVVSLPQIRLPGLQGSSYQFQGQYSMKSMSCGTFIRADEIT